MPNARIRASVKPVPILSAQVRAVQPIARATVAYTKPRMVAYLDEYARNPFRYDEITPSDALFALATIKVLSDNQSHADAYTVDYGKVLSDQTFYAELLQFAIVFTRTFSDSVTALETSTRQYGLNKADAQALSDAVSQFVGKVLADAPTVVEAQAKALAKPFSDPVFQAEVLEFSIAFTRDFGDAIATTDDDPAIGYAAVKTDAVTTPETLAVAFAKVLTDAPTLADSIAKSVSMPFSDSTFYGEVLQFSVEFLRSVADSVTTSESINKFDIAPAYFDAPVINESKAVAFYTSFDDSISLADLFGLLHLQDFYDEVYTVGEGGDFGGSTFNAVTFGDMIGGDYVEFGFGPAKADYQYLAEQLDFLTGWLRDFADTVSQSETLSLGIGAALADAQAVADTLTTNLSWVRSYSDTFTLADDDSFALAKPAVETVSVSDTYSDVIDFQRATTDSVSETDALFVGFGNVEADTATITDSQALANTFARIQNDANIVAETYMLIQTTSVATVPATLDRSTFNALPFNKEGSYTTNSTVQVV